jgi:cation diffusion facilitator CzcD-associated flavoprotein CzcO
MYAYIKEHVTKHALGSHIAFNTKVVTAEWQTGSIENSTKSGACTTSIAEVILLHIPNMPLIPGLDDFKGFLFHSS